MLRENINKSAMFSYLNFPLILFVPAIYNKQRIQRSQQWKDRLQPMVDAWTESLVPSPALCVKCAEPKVVYHCRDCWYGALYCKECYSAAHQSMIFHQPLTWNVSVKCMYQSKNSISQWVKSPFLKKLPWKI